MNENVDAFINIIYKYLDKNDFIYLYLDKSDLIYLYLNKLIFYRIYLYLNIFFFHLSTTLVKILNALKFKKIILKSEVEKIGKKSKINVCVVNQKYLKRIYGSKFWKTIKKY
jgi:hypothetical protein